MAKRKQEPAPLDIKKETWLQRERRWKARKFTTKWSYRRGVFHTNKQELIDWLSQDDIAVRVHAAGSLNDGSEFIQITIEGIR